MDSNVVEAKVVVSGTGHVRPMDASGIKKLKAIGLIKEKKDMFFLDISTAEDNIIRYTCNALPGMVVTVGIMYKFVIA